MDRDLFRLAARLLDEETPCAVATVVRRERPSSAASGNTAVITVDGALHGWIGGSCTRPEVTRHAIASLKDRQPRLLAFGGSPGPRTDMIHVPMSCGSEGRVEVHINPVFPAPRLVVAGSSPIAQAVARLGVAMGYRVAVVGGGDEAVDASGGDAGDAAGDRGVPVDAGGGDVGVAADRGDAHVRADRVLDDAVAAGYAARPPGTALFAVVATMGQGDEEAVERLLAARADYLGVVVSPKRMARVREHLTARGVCGSRIAKVRGPAGLDIGAVGPEEVAVSILAEIVSLARAAVGPGASGDQESATAEDAAISAGAPATATDPVCGMTVPADGSRPSSTHEGRTVHFCCPGCHARFEADPAAYV